MAPKNIWYLIMTDYETMSPSFSFKNDVMKMFIGKAEGAFEVNFEKDFLVKAMKNILSAIEELKREIVIAEDKNVKDTYKTAILLLENMVLIKKDKEDVYKTPSK